ncbi:MAG: DUF2971 domain-containing protein [Ruminococcaceae bacterium]|nr:DUF2971 domain-containing protein [Oscillospiraceae bacterium]
MENTEYLYHYTNLETLALILKKRTIRFNSLDKMDDLQEKETADIRNIGQFFYISSWTEDATENIPMWNMYASLNSGIRIKLRKNPFKVYENTAVDLSHVIHASVTDNSDGKPLLSIIPLAEMFAKGFIAPQAMERDLLRKVEYTDDKDKLYPKMLTENGNQFVIAMGELGRYKNLHWSFQSEWRYILNILPIDLNQPVESSMKDFQLVANKMRWGIANQPFPHYDMVIADDAFADMEITLSPRISAGNRIIVQALVEKYNPAAVLCDSSLLGLI